MQSETIIGLTFKRFHVPTFKRPLIPTISRSNLPLFHPSNLPFLQPSTLELILQKRKFKKTKEEQILTPLFSHFSAAIGGPRTRKRCN